MHKCPATSPVWPTKISHQYCFLLCWVAHHLLYQWFSFFLFFKEWWCFFFFFFSVNYHPFESDIPCQSQEAMQLSNKRVPNAFTSSLQKLVFFFFVQFIYFLWLGESKISLHWSILAFELVFFFLMGFCFQFKPSPFCSRCISVFMRVCKT